MDHYKVLGISPTASKDEIKKAYRKLAMQFHPDKHVHSPNNLKQAATLKFRLISQAYDTLIDDRKRSDYSANQYQYNRTTNHHNYRTNTYTNSYNRSYNYEYGYGYSGSRASGVRFKIDLFFGYLNTKAFLLNAAFLGFLFAGSAAISSGGHTLWEMQNSGKSFEDAMESIEKAKKCKDKT